MSQLSMLSTMPLGFPDNERVLHNPLDFYNCSLTIRCSFMPYPELSFFSRSCPSARETEICKPYQPGNYSAEILLECSQGFIYYQINHQYLLVAMQPLTTKESITDFCFIHNFNIVLVICKYWYSVPWWTDMKYVVPSISFQTFFVQAFKIVIDSWKFHMLLLYILWDDWPIFMISGSNEQLQQQLEYTLLKPDFHCWWISKIQSGRGDTLEEQ